MAERGERENQLRVSDPGPGAQISVVPPSPDTDRSVTLPDISKTGQMHSLKVS